MRSRILILTALLISITLYCGAQEVITSGVCSNGLRWKVVRERAVTLTIQGKGPIVDYPWQNSDNVDRALIQRVVIEEGVTSIGNEAFYYIHNMKSVVIPGTVMSIGEKAFCRCRGLLTIKLPNSVTTIADAAFAGCTNLETIVISESVKSIGVAAFSGCSKLESVYIPSSVTNLGIYAFRDCSSLTSITLSDSITDIAPYTFDNCNSLTSISIPNSVTSIGTYAFEDCYGLESIIVSNSVTSIDGYAFSGCYQLKSIYVSWPRPELISIIAPDPAYDPSYQSLWLWSSGHFPESCTLYVPRGRSEIYRRNAEWNVIKNIEVYDAEPFEPYLTICYDDFVVATQKVQDGNSIEITLPAGYTSVRLKGNSVTGQVRNGVYITPPIAANSTLTVDFGHDLRDNNDDGKLDSQDVLNVYEYIRKK